MLPFITVKVTYEDGDYYVTRINLATLAEAQAYFLGAIHTSEVYSHEKGDFVEIRRRVVNVEEVKQNG